MGLFKRLFRKPPPINAATAKIDEQVYLLNYQDHYAPILGDTITPKRLAELYLFRAWIVQFGYRIFSSNPAASERLIGETVNSCRYIGLGVFQQLHGFSVEDVLGQPFIDLIENRWRSYDLCVCHASSSEKLPILEIIAVLTEHLNVSDPTITYQLSFDLGAQLDAIKTIAIKLGILV